MLEPIPPAFLGVRDAIAYSGMTRSRLYCLLKCGKLQAVKAGNQTLLSRPSIDRFMQSLPEWQGAGASPRLQPRLDTHAAD